ncbi:MAG: S49 family peptidase [Gammaproteobacteria bacterium]|nr:S49 family peptidase [Gammaproteobacteria bacterium]
MELDETNTKETSWERELLQRFAFAALTEQRRARRWGIFFKLLVMGYLLLVFFSFRHDPGTPERISGKHVTALVEVNGEIAADGDASADRIISGLRAAFAHAKTKGVILRINSPGGSPVQAGYINDELFRLKTKHPGVPVYAVITDICASGGYYIAAAADQIYADKASVVGSIGVLMDGFGFVDAMKTLGVERRLLTAGSNQGFLDPFSPLNQDDVTQAQSLLNEVHQQFIDAVRKGRGDRLADDPRLYSGFIWTGSKSLELGLVDGLGSSSYVASELIGAEDIVDFTPRAGLVERLSRQIATSLATALRGSMLRLQ